MSARGGSASGGHLTDDVAISIFNAEVASAVVPLSGTTADRSATLAMTAYTI